MEKFSIFEWKKGELAFFLGVVAVILGISFFQLKTGAMKTRDAQRKADVELVARALVRYRGDYGVVPPASDSGKIASCGREGKEVCEWDSGEIVDADNVTYLKKLPQEPLSSEGRKYMYVPGEDKTDFRIYVALEYKRDPAWKNNLTVQCGQNVECNWYVEN